MTSVYISHGGVDVREIPWTQRVAPQGHLIGKLEQSWIFVMAVFVSLAFAVDKFDKRNGV